MNIFKRARTTKVVDNTDTIVYDFKLRAPFWSYRTVEYHEYAPFVVFSTAIEEYLINLFGGELDSGNGNTLDNLICDMARQAERDLEKQHIEHGDTLKSFDIRNKADRKAFQHELALLQEELLINEKTQYEINARMEKDKFLGGYEHV